MNIYSKRGSVVLAVLAAVALAGACTSSPEKQESTAGYSDCDAKPNECNGGPTKPGGTLTYLEEQDISTWNVNHEDGAHYPTGQMLSGVVPSAVYAAPDLLPYANLDLLAEEPQLTSASPQTMVWKIRPEAVWNDGNPITADDFLYVYKTNNGHDCECPSGSTSGYELAESVVASDGGKTITMTLRDGEVFADWRSLFGALYPAHIAEQHGGTDTPEGLLESYIWFADTQPEWSGGPYQIESYEKGQQLILVPNARWYGKTKPSLEKLIFKIVTDQSSVVPALSNGELDAGDPQPNQDIVTQVAELPGIYSTVTAGPTWEHIDLNLENPLLKDKALREAIFRAIDRQGIIDRTVGAFHSEAAPLNSHNYLPGDPSYVDVVSDTGAGAGDVDEAKKVLTDAGYTGVGVDLKAPSGEDVSLRFTHTVDNVLRADTAQLVQRDLAELGIDIQIVTTSSLGRTLTSGDFDIIIFAWVGSPFVLTGADQLWGMEKDGNWAGNYGHWANQEADDLIQEAQAAGLTDPAKGAELLNQADKIMAEDYYNLPLFQKPALQIARDTIANIRPNTTSSGPAYNISEWGLREAA